MPAPAGQRLLDVGVAGLGVIVLAPLLLAIALWVRLDSPGPALYRQERVGRHGRPFRIHKFRTMVQAGGPIAGAPAEVTVAGDPRITRAGRWLRRTKLDELPQLFDVLAGSMSLVGPRPEVARYVEHYPPELRERLLSVRPGLTDPASLAFRDEERLLASAADPARAYVERVLPAKLAMSARYLDERTFWSDARLLWRTLAQVWQ